MPLTTSQTTSTLHCMVSRVGEQKDVVADFQTLLGRARDGEADAQHRLMRVVQQRLVRLARLQLRRRPVTQSWETHTLADEAFVRLLLSDLQIKDRAHYLAVAATTIRRILIQHARTASRIKRGGTATHVSLSGVHSTVDTTVVDYVALDEALERLARLAPRQARIVEMRHFGGMHEDEMAAELHCSTRTVQREWQAARTYLFRWLGGAEVA